MTDNALPGALFFASERSSTMSIDGGSERSKLVAAGIGAVACAAASAAKVSARNGLRPQSSSNATTPRP